MSKLMISEGKENISEIYLLNNKNESCNISLCIEKNIRYSSHFNNFLDLLHFTNVIAWEKQSMRKSAWRARLGSSEQ